MKGTEAKSDVLVLPGFMGTTLRERKENRRLWSGTAMLWTNLDSLDPDNNSVLRAKEPLWPIYTSLCKALNEAGYRVHFRGYDWRRSIVENARRLESWMFGRFGSHPVDIVSHSMGGCITALILAAGTRCRIGRTVYIGVPFGGAETALTVLLEGLPEASSFNFHANPQQLLRVIRTMQSVYDLLPPIPGIYDINAWPKRGGISREFLESAEKTRDTLDAAVSALRRRANSSHIIIGAGEHMRAWEDGDGIIEPALPCSGWGDGVILSERAQIEGLPARAYYRSIPDILGLKLHLPVAFLLGSHPMLPMFPSIQRSVIAFLRGEEDKHLPLFRASGLKDAMGE